MSGPTQALATFMTRCGCERRTILPTPLKDRIEVVLRRETTFGDLMIPKSLKFAPVQPDRRTFRLRRSWIGDNTGMLFADYTEE